MGAQNNLKGLVELETTTTSFNFDGVNVRTVQRDGEPWFVAADVCEALDVKDASMACSRLDEDEAGTSLIGTPSGRQSMLTINESGLYSLILSSRKPEAKRFKKWVTSEVLPTIRKTGQYGGQPRVQNPSTQAIIDSLLKFDALEQEQRRQAAEIVQLTSGLRTLEARTQPENKHFTVMGWANLQGHKIDITKAAKLGRQCSALSKELGVPTGEVSDPRFGKVKSYHESVLMEVMAA